MYKVKVHFKNNITNINWINYTCLRFYSEEKELILKDVIDNDNNTVIDEIYIPRENFIYYELKELPTKINNKIINLYNILEGLREKSLEKSLDELIEKYTKNE